MRLQFLKMLPMPEHFVKQSEKVNRSCFYKFNLLVEEDFSYTPFMVVLLMLGKVASVPSKSVIIQLIEIRTSYNHDRVIHSID